MVFLCTFLCINTKLLQHDYLTCCDSYFVINFFQLPGPNATCQDMTRIEDILYTLTWCRNHPKTLYHSTPNPSPHSSTHLAPNPPLCVKSSCRKDFLHYTFFHRTKNFSLRGVTCLPVENPCMKSCQQSYISLICMYKLFC